MVVIRLSRHGKKNHATYRFIVSDKRKDTVGTFLEQLGTYDPHQAPGRIELKEDRVKHWLSVGAQPSDTVHNLLVDKGIISGTKRVVAKAKKSAEAPAAVTSPAAAAPTETPAAEAAPEAKPVAESPAA